MSSTPDSFTWLGCGIQTNIIVSVYGWEAKEGLRCCYCNGEFYKLVWGLDHGWWDLGIACYALPINLLAGSKKRSGWRHYAHSFCKSRHRTWYIRCVACEWWDTFVAERGRLVGRMRLWSIFYHTTVDFIGASNSHGKSDWLLSCTLKAVFSPPWHTDSLVLKSINENMKERPCIRQQTRKRNPTGWLMLLCLW